MKLEIREGAEQHRKEEVQRELHWNEDHSASSLPIMEYIVPTNTTEESVLFATTNCSLIVAFEYPITFGLYLRMH